MAALASGIQHWGNRSPNSRALCTQSHPLKGRDGVERKQGGSESMGVLLSQWCFSWSWYAVLLSRMLTFAFFSVRSCLASDTEKQVTRYAQLASNILCCHHAPRCNDLFSETEEDKQATQEINEQKGERVCKCPPWDLVLHCRLIWTSEKTFGVEFIYCKYFSLSLYFSMQLYTRMASACSKCAFASSVVHHQC